MTGRKLSQPASTETRAFAMRRTFRKGVTKEQRLDGREHELKGLLFAEVDAQGRIRLGNGSGLIGAIESDAAPAIVERFLAFENALGNVRDDSAPLDPEIQRGLEALGYLE